ncbi:MAG: retropepsin-like domain-containing protein [Bacteroidaceae bacterium]|nr:retropepsin-like domain-containing protein [Bacteroidaceae bacterium]
MKPLIIFITSILCLLALETDAQSETYNLKRFSFSQSDFADTIPLEWTASKAFVIVEVNGQRMRFMIDTGSSMSVIYEQAIASRGDQLRQSLNTTGVITMHDALGATTKVDVVEAASFKIGKTAVEHYPLTVMRRAVGTVRCDGILGFDIINRGLTVRLDTRARQLVLTDRPKLMAKEQKAGHTLRYTLHRYIPYIMLQPFDTMDEEMAFDTGCSFICLINADRLRNYEYIRPHEVSEQVSERNQELVLVGSLSNDTTRETTLLHLQTLRWKKHEMNDIEAQTTMGRSRVGAAMMERGVVIIDGMRRRITLCPYL